MGCDTAADHNGTTVYRADGKISIFEVGEACERVLLGSAGNSAIRSVLGRHWKLGDVPQPNSAVAEADEWAAAAAEAITEVLANATPPLVMRQDQSADTLDGCLLLAWRQHLWIVHTHSALRPQSGIATIGSGCELALGSLHTVARSGLVHPEAAVSYAIELACTYDSGCAVDERGPIVYSTVAD
jgi:ATP-dependent protease HslVU (ClpYQ) peptidase subunit